MKTKKLISIIIIITMFVGVSGVSRTYANAMTIKDIKPSDGSYDMVQWVINQGYMSIALGKFFPAKYVKRSEFAAIICKLTGSGTVLQNPQKQTFQDVTPKNQFYRQIETSKSYMTYFKSKTGKIFKPDSYLTREDAIMSILKVLGYDSDEAWSDSTDVSLDDLIADAGKVNPSLIKYVSICVSNELMDLRVEGEKYYFDPKNNITRKDLAILIYNAYQKKDYTVEDTNDNSSSDTDAENGNTNTNQNSDGNGSVNYIVTTPEQSDGGYSFVEINEPVSNIDKSKDSVFITKISPNNDLEENIQTDITVEVEYSLISKKDAKLYICFNDGGQAQYDLVRATIPIEKGFGKYRFKIPETPVYRDNDIAYSVSAALVDSENAALSLSNRVNLNFVRMDKFNLSDCVSFFKGIISKVYSPVKYVNPKQNGVHINWINSDTDLTEGVETNLRIEVEYSLVSQDGAYLAICYNNSDYDAPKAQMENARWEVKKGTGKYIFDIPVTPKRWNDGTPFQISAQLHNYEDTAHPDKHNAYIIGVPPVELPLR